MADREKVKKGLENCITGFDCPPECPYLHDCHDLMKPMFVELAKDAYDLLKEQEKKKFLVDSDGNITPLTDREQDYRTWIIDMFHKYNRDDLIALMVQKGEESILAGLLKEQEPKKVIIDLYGNYCPWCSTKISRAMGTQKLHLGTKFCPFCGKKVKWE